MDLERKKDDTSKPTPRAEAMLQQKTKETPASAPRQAPVQQTGTPVVTKTISSVKYHSCIRMAYMVLLMLADISEKTGRIRFNTPRQDFI